MSSSQWGANTSLSLLQQIEKQVALLTDKTTDKEKRFVVRLFKNLAKVMGEGLDQSIVTSLGIKGGDPRTASSDSPNSELIASQAKSALLLTVTLYLQLQYPSNPQNIIVSFNSTLKIINPQSKDLSHLDEAHQQVIKDGLLDLKQASDENESSKAFTSALENLQNARKERNAVLKREAAEKKAATPSFTTFSSKKMVAPTSKPTPPPVPPPPSNAWNAAPIQVQPEIKKAEPIAEKLRPIINSLIDATFESTFANNLKAAVQISTSNTGATIINLSAETENPNLTLAATCLLKALRTSLEVTQEEKDENTITLGQAATLPQEFETGLTLDLAYEMSIVLGEKEKVMDEKIGQLKFNIEKFNAALIASSVPNVVIAANNINTCNTCLEAIRKISDEVNLYEQSGLHATLKAPADEPFRKPLAHDTAQLAAQLDARKNTFLEQIIELCKSAESAYQIGEVSILKGGFHNTTILQNYDIIDKQIFFYTRLKKEFQKLSQLTSPNPSLATIQTFLDTNKDKVAQLAENSGQVKAAFKNITAVDRALLNTSLEETTQKLHSLLQEAKNPIEKQITAAYTTDKLVVLINDQIAALNKPTELPTDNPEIAALLSKFKTEESLQAINPGNQGDLLTLAKAFFPEAYQKYELLANLAETLDNSLNDELDQLATSLIKQTILLINDMRLKEEEKTYLLQDIQALQDAVIAKVSEFTSGKLSPEEALTSQSNPDELASKILEEKTTSQANLTDRVEPFENDIEITTAMTQLQQTFVNQNQILANYLDSEIQKLQKLQQALEPDTTTNPSLDPELGKYFKHKLDLSEERTSYLFSGVVSADELERIRDKVNTISDTVPEMAHSPQPAELSDKKDITFVCLITDLEGDKPYTDQDQQMKGIAAYFQYVESDGDQNSTLCIGNAINIDMLKQILDCCLATGRPFQLGDADTDLTITGCKDASGRSLEPIQISKHGDPVKQLTTALASASAEHKVILHELKVRAVHQQQQASLHRTPDHGVGIPQYDHHLRATLLRLQSLPSSPYGININNLRSDKNPENPKHQKLAALDNYLKMTPLDPDPSTRTFIIKNKGEQSPAPSAGEGFALQRSRSISSPHPSFRQVGQPGKANDDNIPPPRKKY